MRNHRHFTSSHAQTAGFTLVEILVALAILGILYSLAMPSYSRYLQESRRSEAQQLVLQQAAALERIYSRQGGYPKTFSATIGDYYDLSYTPSEEVTPDRYRAFVLTATPKSGSAQAADRCGALSFNQQGVKTPSSDDCWK
ncbi:type IV pilin protein [Pseudoalteromonas fenneropenaei]|uniref:Type IV pilin protein n=1 Tax=Pseudoalteromonas fenneropenaei TaxID=1737459 RepID=A0ABV7CM10_9GAMM